MKITAITAQKRNNNRVNISVDGCYRFSLDLYQLVDMGIKVGSDFSDKEISLIEKESQFGKVYSNALEYCLMRLHSSKEVKDYLYRKTRPKRDKNGNLIPGIPAEITIRVYDRLVEKGYIDDEKFARYWVDNRSISKGISKRKLTSELFQKGIDASVIDKIFCESERDDKNEIKKIINKKRHRYDDNKKFIAYLSRLGFSYDLIKIELDDESDSI